VPREELFLSSKLWPKDYGFESTKTALKGTLKRLDIDYIDLFLIHWPFVPSYCKDKNGLLAETWRALELLYDTGYCRSIGVSNYEIDDLEKLFETCSIKPHVNQLEFHPYQNPKELKLFCEENKITTQGYCPLGKGRILNDKPFCEIAKKHNKSSAQILIRWAVQNNVAAIPKSTRKERVIENVSVFDFKLDDQDMHILDNLHDGRRYCDPIEIQNKIDDNLPDGHKLFIID
jgi:hypothetical protein